MSIDSQLDSQSRREALERMFKGSLAAGSLAAGSLNVMPSAQAADSSFTDDERSMLEAVAYTLFPHASLDKSNYAAVVTALQGALTADAGKLENARETLATLQQGGFLSASQSEREGQLRAVEKSDFFSVSYGTTLNTLYSDKAVWAKFGYGGSAVEHGGYLKRGFNNINWLPRRK